LKLYNRLFDRDYRVVSWPDELSSAKEIDALCRDDDVGELAIEHTRIEAFEGEKADSARFLQTLAGLEDHPELLQPGYDIDLVQAVGSIPTGVDWAGIRREQLEQLKRVVAEMPVGRVEVPVRGNGWEMRLKVGKARAIGRGSIRTQRAWPGDPGPGLILKALSEKTPKLAKYVGAQKILLLEKDAVAGTIESKFEQALRIPEAERWLQQIDAVWAVNTMCLESERVIFTNEVWPGPREHISSLNLKTGQVWRRPY
jgi:hypothetical protein